MREVTDKPAADATPDSTTIAVPPTEIVLTFDDGPHPSRTPKLLATLSRLKLKALFFVVGSNAARHSAVMQSIRQDGHQLGNHSYTHPDLAKLDAAAVKAELDRTQALVGAGQGRNWFRPPYGSLNATVRRVAADAGLTTVLWDVDPEDWKYRSPAWVDRALAQIRPGKRNVLLMHDIHETTVDQVETLILRIRLKYPGVRFVPMS